MPCCLYDFNEPMSWKHIKDRAGWKVYKLCFKLCFNCGRSNPKYICGFFWRFLMVPLTSIYAQVLGSRVNHGAGYGLEVPLRFIF